MYALLMENRDQDQREEFDDQLHAPVTREGRDRDRQVIASLLGRE